MIFHSAKPLSLCIASTHALVSATYQSPRMFTCSAPFSDSGPSFKCSFSPRTISFSSQTSKFQKTEPESALPRLDLCPLHQSLTAGLLFVLPVPKAFTVVILHIVTLSGVWRVPGCHGGRLFKLNTTSYDGGWMKVIKHDCLPS